MTVDQNIERVDLPEAFSAFQYQQGGNRLLICRYCAKAKHML
ncbi:MAG: hypothetical protein WCP34_14420 [Pseudomonadota bacterium]